MRLLYFLCLSHIAINADAETSYIILRSVEWRKGQPSFYNFIKTHWPDLNSQISCIRSP